MAWCFLNNTETWKYFRSQKKKKKNQQAVFRMEVPFQLNKLCAAPVKPVVSPGAVQEP